MATTVVAALVAVGHVLTTIQQAIAAGKSEITDDQMDAMFASLADSDAALSDAIARARAREEGGE